MPVTITYSYDAASNRTAMTDGPGTVSYQYDQLSRLLTETRGFTGVGNYTISYQYNLANDLKSITDPLNSTINYTRDNAGRLTIDRSHRSNLCFRHHLSRLGRNEIHAVWRQQCHERDLQ